MTEKRFTMSKTEFDSEFGVGRFLLDNGKRMTYEEVVDLLNELWEKNEQLKEAKYGYKEDWKQASANCDLYKQEISFLKDEIKGFEEENDQLKSLLKEAEDEIKTLKQNNKGLLESLVEHESED